MFNFAPPAKVARTQRSSVSQASVQHYDTSSASVGLQRSSLPPSQSQRTVEFPENPTATLRQQYQQQQAVGLAGRGALSGIGSRVAWRVDATSVQLWTVDSETGAVIGPALFPVPSFDSTANPAAFVAEWEAEETVLLCSRNGVVRSLDSRVEFQFDSDDVAIEVSAFAVLGNVEKGSCLVVAGTSSGLVLSYNIRSSDDDAGVLDTRLIDAPRALSASTGSGWLSWLTGGRASASHQPRRGAAAAATRPSSAIVKLIFSTTNANHLWAIQAHEVLLVDIAAGPAQFQIVFAVDLESSIGANGEVLCLESTIDGALVVYRYFDARSEKDALALVSISSKSGTVTTVTALSGLGSLVTARNGDLSSGVVSLASRARQGQDVTIVYGSCAIRVNNAAGVRHPCTSEDVTVLTRRNGTSVTVDSLAAAKVIGNHNGDVLLLDGFTGPYVASPDASRAVTATRGGTDGQLASPTFPHNNSEFLTPGGSMSQRIAGILSASRVDARATVDEIVLNAVDEILQNTPLHAANWARVDLHSEDINLFTHVSRNLVQRQEEHRALVGELYHKHQDETWAKLSLNVIASLVSVQEQLQCLVEIRRLQNDLQQSVGTAEATITNLLSATALSYSHQNLQQTSVIVAAAAEEHCQALLRRAVVDVADVIRAEVGTGMNLPSSASSAEVTFGKPENICTLLRRLNTIVSDSWVASSAAGNTSYAADVESRVRLTIAASFVFTSILHTIRSSRTPMALPTKPERSTRAAQRTVVAEEIERDDDGVVSLAGHGGSVVSLLQRGAATGDALVANIVESLFPDARARESLWTSGTTGGATGLEAALWDQAIILSDALAVLSNSAMTSGAGGVVTGQSRSGLNALQQTVLDMLVVMVDSILKHSSSPASASDLIRRVMLRPPFVDQCVGFPFGSPSAPSNHSLGQQPSSAALSLRKAVIEVAEAFATQHRLYDIMYLFAAGDYHPDPEAAAPANSHFATMRKYIASHKASGVDATAASEFLPYCIEALAGQDREPEVLALPVLLGESGISPDGSAGGGDIQALRDALLRQYLPHLHWQADPTAFYSLREEGAQGNPNVAYGATLLEHRSRCLSMAKLGWIASGAPVSGHYDDVVTDELVVEAQRKYLSDPTVSGYSPNDAPLTTTEAVQRLVVVASSSPSSSAGLSARGSPDAGYWELAAAIASRTPLPLRGELSALILKEALCRDGLQSILSIPSDAVSERELLQRFAATVTGRVLLASPPLRSDYQELGNTLERALTMLGGGDGDVGARLCKVLSSWIALRATTR